MTENDQAIAQVEKELQAALEEKKKKPPTPEDEFAKWQEQITKGSCCG